MLALTKQGFNNNKQNGAKFCTNFCRIHQSEHGTGNMVEMLEKKHHYDFNNLPCRFVKMYIKRLHHATGALKKEIISSPGSGQVCVFLLNVTLVNVTNNDRRLNFTVDY